MEAERRAAREARFGRNLEEIARVNNINALKRDILEILQSRHRLTYSILRSARRHEYEEARLEGALQEGMDEALAGNWERIEGKRENNELVFVVRVLNGTIAAKLTSTTAVTFHGGPPGAGIGICLG